MSRCPTPGKLAFSSAGEAYAYLDRSGRRRTSGATRPTKAYLCRCGDWHVAGPGVDVKRVERSRQRDKKNSHRRSGRRRDQRSTRRR